MDLYLIVLCVLLIAVACVLPSCSRSTDVAVRDMQHTVEVWWDMDVLVNPDWVMGRVREEFEGLPVVLVKATSDRRPSQHGRELICMYAGSQGNLLGAVDRNSDTQCGGPLGVHTGFRSPQQVVATLVHEIGHTLGLPHNFSDPTSWMWASSTGAQYHFTQKEWQDLELTLSVLNLRRTHPLTR